MMSPLFLLDVAAKAAQMTERDPHGWIMTLVAVSVVFLSLFVLQYCYRFIGWMNKRNRQEKRHRLLKKRLLRRLKRQEGQNPEVAAAIATALSLETSGQVQAAIALALDRYFNECVHDRESYVITIKHRQKTYLPH